MLRALATGQYGLSVIPRRAAVPLTQARSYYRQVKRLLTESNPKGRPVIIESLSMSVISKNVISGEFTVMNEKEEHGRRLFTMQIKHIKHKQTGMN